MNFENETIWIIGASSGIGRELAMQLAASGAKLILSARGEDKLLQLQKELGQEHKIYTMDVSDLSKVKEVCTEIAQLKGGVNRVIFMSALYKPDSVANMDLDFMSAIVDVNIKGAMYITHGILPIFEKQKSGQIVLCGSVAGYTGLPNGQPYSATKAAVVNFAESLYLESPDYIDIKLISPGFVSTPMTDKNEFDMPMIIKPEVAASSIVKGLNKSAFEIHFPKRFTFIMKIIKLLPYSLYFRLLKIKKN